ncbi:AT-rich interactive domain-containing protein 6 isoform X1 [Arachis duranensis]|uniref:AT-rich interactive domain-containing protein 6 isoform X1 n=1 Tax=Arachis duranensis TaxID=130453 RepID=A0A6P5MP92_ARADU|nr:AT-rich interactive domain-containing protein 6 isoform X1 [Arachis duranensis]XP_057741352.1 AT-rich interactive domain-containing protein 6-like isoform X1 [Arachis stenosperma]
MEDGPERLVENSHENSEMEVVDDDDAALQRQHHSEKDQNVDSNSPAQLQQDHVMFDRQSDDNKNANSALLSVLETKTDSSNTRHENRFQDLKVHSHHELLTPKPKERNVREMKNVLHDTEMTDYDESGSYSEREAFMRELESFYRERSLEFKPPKFYGEPLNCLKLWRAVIKLGGYDVVTGSKLWRQVGESFHPPKTCTTVSWTFRIFYEKALLEYEKYKREIGELQLPVGSFHQSSSVEKETAVYQAPGSGSGRARRDAAARAMQGWHAQRLLGYGEVAEPVIKDKNSNSTPKREKNLKSIGMLNKHRTPSVLEHAGKAANIEGDRQLVTAVVDVGPPADWVKVNVRETKDCFEVYALVPGLLREEVRVQSDPVGRLVITGLPEHVDNPWGITPFKKVVNLPARIDPLQTSAVVSLHGRLFVRVPFEQGAV